jgi:lipopolysaccharide export system permease protein
MSRTLLRYTLVEQAVPFGVSLLVLTIVLFTAKVMSFLHLVFASESDLGDLGKMLVYLIPYFFVYTLPLATLLGVLAAFSRLSHHNEITAMKAAGIGFYQLLPPVALVAGTTWVLSLALTHFVLPGGNIAFKRALLDMARSTAQLSLKERLFNDQVKGMVFLVNRISPDGRHFHDVLISDERDPAERSTIMAEEGFLLSNADEEGFSLKLLRGTILKVGKKMRSAQTIRFQEYDLYVNLTSAFGAKEFRKKERHMTEFELRRAIALAEPRSVSRYKLLMEWHRRFSLPFACVVFAFIAAPLGVLSGTTSRLTGVILGLCLFLLYYALVSLGKAIGENGLCPPFLGLWLPNLFFTIIAILMWERTTRESPFQPAVKVRQMAASIISRLTTQ